MAANVVVQTQIDSAVKERASAVLEEMGITISDAMRILLTRTANEGALPFSPTEDAAEHDAWFRAKVLEALDDTRPDISEEEIDAEFSERRAAALRKAH